MSQTSDAVGYVPAPYTGNGLWPADSLSLIETPIGPRWQNPRGEYGYRAPFTAAWICYTCGHVCECGDYED